MTARIREFNLFLRDHVNLNQSRIDTLHSRVSALDTALEESVILEDKLDGSLIPQGSFAHRTIIKPLYGNDFDADVLIPMSEQDEWEPKRYTVELKKALDAVPRYAEKTELGKRCVTIQFANDFHIDVVPFIERADGNTYITHRTRNEFIRQDPTALTDWLNEQNSTTNGHLVRTIRLVKWLRDRSSIDCPSVVLAALLAGQVEGSTSLDGYGNVATTFTALLEDLRDYLELHSAPPWVDDRIGQNLADRLTQTGFNNLKSQLKRWARLARKALDADASESIDKWRKLLGDSFGASNVNSAQVLSASVASATPTYEHQMVPGEMTITEQFGFPEQRSVTDAFRIVARMSPTKKGHGRYRPLSANGNLVPIGRSLRFEIDGCTVQEPYDVYWKVRNAGPEAARRKAFRGEIIKRGKQIEETSNFPGAHWVQAWIVKDEVAVATATHDVIIMSR
ncbi:Hypothetical protein GOHSU_41_00430 [Gordonia hirsuta DSM 44140 = NBRC 16056]|uniref:Adenylyl/Guanylyl and SMODS C-terminal sensor domain-containing protein n=1 Tax=Gordonia hirsuta DSM 44140 = NBRC 16056 TaxID=1121927 RepID=L7LC83_9ACTN|nr:nucleotidyltransferase [Gordonia hirsuta]GAC58504.1 Hypothetical protein GOHSU_41_00430 [Gordonia hirsuta DSM 44140 = NBRC 16056]